MAPSRRSIRTFVKNQEKSRGKEKIAEKRGENKNEQSTMSEEDMMTFLELGNLLVDTVIRNAEPTKQPEMCPSTWVVLYEYPFKTGLRLPFSPLARDLMQICIDHGLHLYPSSISTLVSYTDADLGGCPDTRRSTSGYCVFLGENLVSWSAKRQPTLSRSSAEAEYRGVANVVSESCWLRNLLLELHCPISTATLVYCDNVSAIYLSGNPVNHQRTKHIFS